MEMRSIRVPLISMLWGLTLLAVGRVAAFDCAYWGPRATHSKRLTEAEQQELDVQHIGVIYWQVGELAFRGGSWRWEDDPIRTPPTHQRVVSVVRLTAKKEDTSSSFKNPEGLMTKVRMEFDQNVDGIASPVVIDFTGSDTIPPDYAAFLARLHDAIPKLAVIVPANWITQPEFGLVQKSVVEIEVLVSNSNPISHSLSAGIPLDMVELKKTLALWSHCAVPWKAVLPTGATVTVCSVDGVPRSILHDWSWSETLFNSALSPVSPMVGGIVKFRAQRATQVAEEGVSGDEAVIAAIPERTALAQSLVMAKGAGASGAIFLLPSTGRDEGGWSLRQLGHLEESDVRLTFRMEDSRLVLCNGSRADLPPRCEAADDRGYTLEVIADDKDWADAAQGDFFDLNGYKDEEKKDQHKVLRTQANKGNLSHPIVTPSHTAVTVPMANRLQLHFGFLRAGECLHTGFVRLTPGVELSTLRYRVLPIQKEWKPLD